MNPSKSLMRMSTTKIKQVTTDEIQYISSNGVELHPHLYQEFLNRILEMERKKKICALPITRLQHYSTYIEDRLDRRLHSENRGAVSQ